MIANGRCFALNLIAPLCGLSMCTILEFLIAPRISAVFLTADDKYSKEAVFCINLIASWRNKCYIAG